MQVKSDGRLFDPIGITEGVLQGEVLSPLLFCLYISDIIAFFKEYGAEGVFISAHEILMLLYADDIVLSSTSEVRLRKHLKILKEYCRLNDLTVNIGKTQVLPCKTSGRIPRKLEKFCYDGEDLAVVTSYEYLGLKFNTSLKGNLAAVHAMKKGKAAIGIVLNIIKNLKDDN